MKKIALAALIVLGSVSAQAADAGAYAGFSGGNSYSKANQSDWEGTSKTDSGNTYKLFGGYQINKFVAAEMAYANLGTTDFSWKGYANEGFAANYKKSAISAAAVGSLPLGNFALNGKLGLTLNRAETDFRASVGTAVGSDRKTTSKVGIVYGLGASYAVTKNLDIRAEYENYGKFGKAFGDDSVQTGRMKNVSAVTLGLAVRF